jgi:hypothetical protein
MGAILTSAYCLPCVWSLIGILGIFGVCSYILNIWVPFRGPLPSDGPVEGFASKQARIEFFDTGPKRIRAAFKAGVIGGVLWLAGLLTVIVILGRMKG